MSDGCLEPIPGLPEALPPGERIIWQGRPNGWRLARQVFHLRVVTLYLAALVVVRGWTAWVEGTDGTSVVAALAAALGAAAWAATGVGLLVLIGWLSARATMYTITDRRVVLRIGVALPVNLNLPFGRLASAALREGQDGYGDISLALAGADRLAYLLLWPHARPWRFGRAEPTLRAVPEAARVGALLAGAMTEAAYGGRTRVRSESLPIAGLPPMPAEVVARTAL